MWVPFFLLEILSQRIYSQCHHQRLGRVQSYREGLSNVAMGMVAVRRGKTEGNYSVYTKEKAVYRLLD